MQHTQTDNTLANSSASPASLAIANNVRELMLRHGIPKRSLSTKLAEILNLGYAQAHRKLNGGEWSGTQLRQVEEYFQESITGGKFIPPASEEPGAPAILSIESQALACLLWVSGRLHSTRNVEFVAWQREDAWHVVPAANAPTNAKLYKVKKLELCVRKPKTFAIAILDDEKDAADNLRDYLNECGFNAIAFYDTDATEKAMRETLFDGYIVDWYLRGQTAETFIHQIRQSENADAPIFLLTGALSNGRANESEVARVIMDYDVICQEKPTRLPIIVAELTKALNAD